MYSCKYRLVISSENFNMFTKSYKNILYHAKTLLLLGSCKNKNPEVYNIIYGNENNLSFNEMLHFDFSCVYLNL